MHTNKKLTKPIHTVKTSHHTKGDSTIKHATKLGRTKGSRKRASRKA
jgi:hypothetical protein